MSKIASEDGLFLFWQHGFVGFVGRDLFYSGIRIGAYPTVKQFYAGDGNDDIPLGTKIAAGMSTGAFGSAIANPFDVVRVRHSSEGGRIGLEGKYETGLFKGKRPTFTSSADLLTQIYKQEGVINGLWRGTSATMTRAAFLSGGQLASYDHSKVHIKAAGLLPEGTTLHFVCAIISGLVATTVCNPPDVLKSRMMVAQAKHGSGGHVQGVGAVCLAIYREGGLLGFFRGWTAAYARAGPAYFIQMPLVEKLLQLLDVRSL
jgi:hypothetical protein